MKTLIALLLLVTTISFSQTTSLNVRESNEFKDEVKSDDVLAIYTTNNNITGIVRNSKKDLLFDAFDASLNKIYSKVVESSKKEDYVGDVYYGDVIKVFTVFSPSKSERTIYCHNFNIQTKSYEKIEVFSTTVEKNQSLFSGGNKRKTGFSLSPNGKYLAIITDDIKKNLNSYTARVFEASTLELTFETSYQEDEEKFFEPNDMVVDNSGTVYSVGKKFIKGRSEKKNGEANYDFILNKITKDQTSTLLVDLGKDEHIRSLMLSLNEGNLRMMGFFSERNVNRVKGGYNMVVDVSDQLSVLKKNTFNLPISVYEDLYGDKRADKKKDSELSNFYIDYFIEDSLGNTYVLAEEFYITQQYVPNGNMGGSTVTVYHYDDILILKFNANNELEWGRSIFKRSTTPSYNAFLKDDQLHVILNSGKNLVEKEDGRTKVSKGFLESTALYDIVFSADGSDSYDKIQDNKGNTAYIPFYGTFRNDKFVMMSSDKNKKQFMILE
ncbi:MAG: hypothetical protein ACSHXF_07300 [Aquaticitalea sp.]